MYACIFYPFNFQSQTSTHFENKAFDATPDDSDANTEITDVDSEGAGTTNDGANQTIPSSPSGHTAKNERRFTNKDK